jgi:RNA polymerase sigma-70 factor (ECF subfamily)
MSELSRDTSTCWTMVRDAAAGDAAQRQAFAQRYGGPVTAYFRARWAASPLAQEAGDAAQDVFVESFREGGALAKVSREQADGGGGGFRGYLFGVAHNVALRYEQRAGRRREGQPPEGLLTHGLIEDEARLSQLFDRAWAETIMRDAARRHADLAAEAGDDAQRRLDLLRLRFGEGLPIREIASRWSADATDLHRQYARAREEFRAALREAVAFHLPGCSAAAVEEECARLLTALG